MNFDLMNTQKHSLYFSSSSSAKTTIMNTNINNNNNVMISVGRYLIAIHRKLTRQDAYFLSHHKTKSSLFGIPLLIPCYENGTNKDVYCAVWMQVNRLLSPLPPQADQANHAADCDDSLGYDFPFTLRAVTNDGRMCALCPWSNFCRGCEIPCNDDLLLQGKLISSSTSSSNSSTPTLSHRFSSLPNLDATKSTTTQNAFSSSTNLGAINIAIDWDPTALHLRYQSTRERLWTEHESLAICRRQQIEPVDLNHCLRSFTSEEKLEQWYHCSHCKGKKPATKKLQIWRLPPILIIHLKRFNFVNDKWVKSQKVVNFPFENFDPTPYLASVPQETILRHKELLEMKVNNNNNNNNNRSMMLVGGGGGVGGNSSRNNDGKGDGHHSGNYSGSSENLDRFNFIKATNTEPVINENDDDYDGDDNVCSNNKAINHRRAITTTLNKDAAAILTKDKLNSNEIMTMMQPMSIHHKTTVTAAAATTTTATTNHTSTANTVANSEIIMITDNCDNYQKNLGLENEQQNITSTSSSARKLSNAKLEKRKRLISTSLTRTPVIDGHLKDFHHHRLKDGEDHLDLKYNLYAVVSHSGMLNGGHYISYASNPNGSWYCYNDSSCREIPNRPNIDPSSAYLLFYERRGLNYEPYLPNIQGRTLPNGNNNAASASAAASAIELDDTDSDLKKMCTIS